MTAFEVVSEIIRKKKEECRRPLHATTKEIYDCCPPGCNFSAELERMVSVRILLKGRTIHYDYYTINGMEL